MKVQLLQSAWSATRQKNTFWHAWFNKSIKRLGRKKASIAIARKTLVSIHKMLKYKIAYSELGASYVDDRVLEKRISYHKRQLKELGVNVEMQA